MDINYHYMIHGFWSERVMGTLYLKVKLMQQLTSMMEEVLYEIFFDLRKTYDALEQDRCMEILATYGLGPRMEHLICRH